MKMQLNVALVEDQTDHIEINFAEKMSKAHQQIQLKKDMT